MEKILATPGLIDTIIGIIIFLLGVLFRAKLMWSKSNSEAIETLEKDFSAMKTLYDAKCDEAKRLIDDNTRLKEDLLQVKARITSYENFLQSRSLETDQALKKVPVILEAVASHLGITVPDEGFNAHESAHSQSK